MSKKLCADLKDLKVKMKGIKPTYYCKKCDRNSTKEKWCCKPKKIK